MKQIYHLKVRKVFWGPDGYYLAIEIPQTHQVFEPEYAVGDTVTVTIEIAKRESA